MTLRNRPDPMSAPTAVPALVPAATNVGSPALNITIFGIFVLCSLPLLFFIGQDFFPYVDSGQMRLPVRAPPATPRRRPRGRRGSKERPSHGECRARRAGRRSQDGPALLMLAPRPQVQNGSDERGTQCVPGRDPDDAPRAGH